MKKTEKLSDSILDDLAGGTLYIQTGKETHRVESCYKTKVSGRTVIALKLEGVETPQYVDLSCRQHDYAIKKMQGQMGDQSKDYLLRLS